RWAIGSTNSAVTPKAAVNHTEFALSRIRRTYQPSNSAVLRGENSRTIDRSEMTSAGLGVSAIAPSLAPASSGSVFTSFQYSKYSLQLPSRRPDGQHGLGGESRTG